jgi:molybdate transport system regulatory protein
MESLVSEADLRQAGGVQLSYQLRTKIWLEKKGAKVFGDGPWDILKRVERTGSLRQAAAEINMSYSQAWRLIKMIEENLGFTVLQKRAGGPGGGHSILTPRAARLTAAYSIFRTEADIALTELYKTHISPLTEKIK